MSGGGLRGAILALCDEASPTVAGRLALCDKVRRLLAKTGEGVGTGAGEVAPRQDTGSAWVTRSEDCPEAPAQAHPLALDPAGQVADEAYAAGYRDGRAEAEARLAAVRALLSLWDSWDGTRPHPGESSPRQREQLRLALGTREDRLRGALGLPALDAIPAESWCCEACRTEGWQCASSCGRPCCVDGGKP